MALKVYKCHSDLFSKNCCLVSRDTGLPATGFGALFTRHPPDRHKMLVDPKLLQIAQNISELIGLWRWEGEGIPRSTKYSLQGILQTPLH